MAHCSLYPILEIDVRIQSFLHRREPSGASSPAERDACR